MRRVALAAVAGLGITAACLPADGGLPEPGKAVPELAAVDLGGDSVTLGAFAGGPYLLNLWATWCAPCRYETPFLQSIYEERASEGFRVVGVSVDVGDSRAAVQDFVDEFGVTYPILLDPSMSAMDRFNVLGLPASFLVDRDGIIRWMRFGAVSETDVDFHRALDAVIE